MKKCNYGKRQIQYELGNCYYYGNGVKKDIRLARQWYRHLAEQGNAKAQYGLGNCYCYYSNLGRIDAAKKAVEWYRKSAEQGDADAQCKLGDCYYYGFGAEANKEEAVKWYSQGSGARA